MEMEMESSRPTEEFPHGAYTLSIIAGSLMVASALVVMVLAGIASSLASHAAYYGYGPMMFYAFPARFAIAAGMAAFGLISGIVVLVSAIMLRRRPSEYVTWGVLIVVFSIFSFFGMGGFIVGAILGIVGGAIALAWSPRGNQR